MWVAEPVPVTVIGYVPLTVPAATWTVIVEELPEVTEEGLKETVTPLGAPLAESWTVCALPPTVVVFTVEVAEAPGWTEPEDGFRASEKSGLVEPPQSVSPDWAGTPTAFQAAFTALHSVLP